MACLFGLAVDYKTAPLPCTIPSQSILASRVLVNMSNVCRCCCCYCCRFYASRALPLSLWLRWNTRSQQKFQTHTIWDLFVIDLSILMDECVSKQIFSWFIREQFEHLNNFSFCLSSGKERRKRIIISRESNGQMRERTSWQISVSKHWKVIKQSAISERDV